MTSEISASKVDANSDLASKDPGSAGGTAYFAVSLPKLAVMSVCTLGFYELYWFYQNWRLIKAANEGLGIMPFWRAFFAFFFCQQCFARIKNHADDLGLRSSVSPGGLAVAWIITTLSWRLPDPYWLVASLSFIPLLPVQALANRINRKETPAHNPNGRFTGWNIATIVLGGLTFALAILATFMPPK